MIGMIEFATSDDGTCGRSSANSCSRCRSALAVGVAGAYLAAARAASADAARPRAVPAAHARGRRRHLRRRVGRCTARAFSPSSSPGSRRRRARAVQGRGRAFLTSLASLAEIVVFVALGLTIDSHGLSRRVWLDGSCSPLVARARRASARRRRAAPAARLRIGERLFVMWGGLKGAVPIFLAAFAILAGVDGRASGSTASSSSSSRFSVLVQGSTIPSRGVAGGRADARRPRAGRRCGHERPTRRLTW